jgi:hypothetical protein
MPTSTEGYIYITPSGLIFKPSTDAWSKTGLWYSIVVVIYISHYLSAKSAKSTSSPFIDVSYKSLSQISTMLTAEEKTTLVILQKRLNL